MHATSEQQAVDIDTPIDLSKSQIEQFRKDGYIKIKNVFSGRELERYRHEITRLVKELNTEGKPLENRSAYGKAFLQIMNLWRHSELVKEFVLGKRLAKIATELLGVEGVRIYHDQALYKEAGGGYTPWHVDQAYWPLSNENTVTAWVPLHPVSIENGPLSFSVGSQKIKFGRDFEISDDSENRIQEHLKMSDFPIDESPYELGEVSFHYGYTFHRAGPNTLEYPREVMTVIYMDSEMRLIEPRSRIHRDDAERWCPGVRVGDIIDTHLNPLVFPQKVRSH